MLFNTVYLITSVFQIYEFYLLLECFLKRTNKSKYIIALSYVGAFVIMTLPYFTIKVPIVNLISAYMGMLMVTVLYEGTIRKKVLSVTFTIGIMVLAECAVAVFSGYVGLSLFQSTEYYSMWGTVCLPIIEFMIVLIVRNFKSMKEGEDVSGAYWVISITLPFLSLYLLMLFYRQTYLSAFDIICCNVALIIINIFVFYLYDEQMQNFKIRREKESLEMQSQYQLNELEIMHGAVENARSLRHDFTKHISMISYINENEGREKTAEYLDEIHNNVKSKYKYVNTGNFVFDSILNYKMEEALSEDIHINVNINIPSELDISTYSMNVILSNLIDNSMEAVRKIEDKKIDVEITYSKNRLRINVINSYEGMLEDENGGYVSMKEDKDNHGYGLKNVKEMVNKYDGVMHIESGNNIFKVFICLFL